MFQYVKFIGDDPVIIDGDKQFSLNDKFIEVKPENTYFLVAMMTQQGQGLVPVPAEDQGLVGSPLIFNTANINMITILDESGPIAKMIKEIKRQKSPIITLPPSGKIIL